MNEDVLITIIVPVFKVEKYLSKCIESILNQTYKNIEIILVDDGSPDDSGKICDMYAKKDTRIKVIHKQNGGAASARNIAIKDAKGSFISFVDSDDEVLPNYIQNMYNLILKYKTELAITPYFIVGNKNKIDIGKNFKEQKITSKECLERLLLSQGFTVSLCAKMYKKSLLLKHPFPEGYPYEDDATMYKIVMDCDTIAYNNESNYLYYKRENSVMSKSFSKDKLILLKYSEEMQKKILAKYPELNETVISKCTSYKFSILRQMVNSKLDLEMINLKNEIIKTLKNDYNKILKSPKSGKKDKCAILSLLLGEWCFKMCWKIYEKLKY